MDETLKACPFCGGRAAYDEIEKTNDTIVRCQGCYAAGAPGGNSVRPDAPDPVAAAAWNRRPVEDALWVAREAAVTRAEVAQGERDAAVARAEAAEAALAAAERRAEAAEAEAEHTTERAITVAWLRSRAETGGDPWMVHVADEIEAGLHVVMHDF